MYVYVVMKTVRQQPPASDKLHPTLPINCVQRVYSTYAAAFDEKMRLTGYVGVDNVWILQQEVQD